MARSLMETTLGDPGYAHRSATEVAASLPTEIRYCSA